MSHIPAHAMPHAAPHHHDNPPTGAEETQDSAMTMEPTATAAPAAAPAPAQPQAASQMANSSRSGWGTTALAAGGVALIAGLVTVGVPLLRRRDQR